MFTGIIQSVGRITAIDMQDGEGTYRFATGALDLAGVKNGDSIAVNGTCLTVTALHEDGFSADLSRETLDCTTLGQKEPEAHVNLEPALRVGDPLGGHLVTGHVDGVGEVIDITPDGESVRLTIRAPESLARYIAQKGSVCVDGTSLTVNSVDGSCFAMMIVPHTQSETIIGSYVVGERVNIEIDTIARYLERFVHYTGGASGDSQDSD